MLLSRPHQPVWSGDLAHLFIGLSGVDTSLDRMVLRFYARADVKHLDTSCVPKMLPPPFKTDQ